MISHDRWMEHGLSKMYLIGDKGKIVAQIDCVDYPMIWSYKGDKYISREAAQEAAEADQRSE